MTRQRIPLKLATRIGRQARDRCGYCLAGEALIGMAMELDHLVPLASGGKTTENNLWLSCRRCNEFKGAYTAAIDLVTREKAVLFNPRLQIWSDHFRWNDDGTEIVGVSPTGRATVAALRLNHPIIVAARRMWVSVGWWPPVD